MPDAIQNLIAALDQSRISANQQPVVVSIDLFVAALNEIEATVGGGITQLTGAVTAGPGAGSQVASIPVNAVSLLGNATGSPANVENITLGTNLSFSGTVLNATGGASPGTVPTVVQSGKVQNSNTVVLGSAPANGNLLIAMSANTGGSTAGAGWTTIALNSSGADFGVIWFKVAGVAESTSQTPASGAITAGSIVMWEIHGQRASNPIVFAGSQVQSAAQGSNDPIYVPNQTNCLGLAFVGTNNGGSGFLGTSQMANLNSQDQFTNGGANSLIGSHTDLSQSTMCGIAALLATGVSAKACVALISST